jgi:hypothetical protein
MVMETKIQMEMLAESDAGEDSDEDEMHVVQKKID